MMRAVTSMVAGALALLAPCAAEASSGLGLTIEGLYGFALPPDSTFKAAVSSVSNRDLSDDAIQLAGADALLNIGTFEIGGIIDTTFGKDEVKQTAIGALAGLRLGDKLRLDALAEAGGHRFGSVADDVAVVTASSADQWLFYVGLRPGLAYRVDLAPGGAGLVIGVWGFVRWDVTDKSVPVTVASATGTAPGDVELGGTTIGMTLRLGLEL